nr:FAD/NAD(P)-binding protein [uncultured Helicobacter sp.]
MTRRDFINGMAVAVVAGMTPLEILARDAKKPYYPPLWQNLVGSDDDSYFFAHALRDGEQYDFSTLPIQEQYDLVVVGAGISGLSSACLFHDKHKGTKSLILDNHKDFGGHARRNEFATPYGQILTYGGSESLQSPKSLYSKKVVEFLGGLNVDIDALAKCFNQDFYPDLGLSRGVFFNKKDFGVSKLVSGDPRVVIDDSIRQERNNARSFEQFIGDFPMPKADKEALLELFTAPKDYLQGLSKKQKQTYLANTSYKQFLQERVQLSPLALSFFDGVSDDFMALGIDMISCELAQECGFPGFESIIPTDSTIEEPYIHHFPDGNASVARLMVKKLIPHIAACGNTPEEVLLAQFDYSKLDVEQNMSRIRLQSTALDVRNVAGGVEIVYGSLQDRKLHKVFAKKVIMANYNAMIPYIVKELQDTQKIRKRLLYPNVSKPLLFIQKSCCLNGSASQSLAYTIFTRLSLFMSIPS